MSRSVVVGFVLLVTVAVVSPADAQCPGTMQYASMNWAFAISTAPWPTGSLYLFIGGGCTTSMFGPNPPTACQSVNTTTTARLTAIFSMTTHNVTANGCVFNCALGTCRVRGGDGLPVELMYFDVEGDEAEAPQDSDRSFEIPF